MPALRQSLKQPQLWLVIAVLLWTAGVADAFRRPELQQTAHLYIAAVHGYQSAGRPLLACRVRCRFQPTCSEYSIAAVQRYGLGAGLGLTKRRLDRCTLAVPMGTRDPVR